MKKKSHIFIFLIVLSLLFVFPLFAQKNTTDFLARSGAYDTSFNSGDYEDFVPKRDGNLSGEEYEYIDFSGTWEGEYSYNRVDMKITIKLKKKNEKKFSGTWNSSGGAYGDCTIKYNKKGIPKLTVIETYPCDGSFKGKLTYNTDTYIEYKIKGSDCGSTGKAEGYANKKD